MSLHSLVKGLFVSVVSAGTILTGGLVGTAYAQDAAGMSCGELWYARNAIYARNGYCFKTDRGRAAFGPGCFPPYGALSPGEQSRVNELQYWERQKGC